MRGLEGQVVEANIQLADTTLTAPHDGVIAVIRDRYNSARILQVWDELRRKVADVQPQLPPSVRGRSMVVDDFGDVYGIFLAISGEGYTFPELRRYAEFLRRQLQSVQDVKKVDLFAEQQEVVYPEISRQRLAQLGINEDEIYRKLQAKNIVVDGGRVRVGSEHLTIDPAGAQLGPGDAGPGHRVRQHRPTALPARRGRPPAGLCRPAAAHPPL